jgi:hypothetical protein
LERAAGATADVGERDRVGLPRLRREAVTSQERRETGIGRAHASPNREAGANSVDHDDVVAEEVYRYHTLLGKGVEIPQLASVST